MGTGDFGQFEFIVDPMDLWMVWDRVTGQPAILNGQYAIGLSAIEAQAAVVQLANVTGADPDALSCVRRPPHPRIRKRRRLLDH